MATREEITEGIKQKMLFEFGFVSPMAAEELEYNADQFAKQLMEYLDSEGIRLPDGEPLIELKELIAEPEPEQSPKCTACEGKGFIEYESGLIQVECEVCKGTGRVLDEVESINPMMITDIEAVNDSSSGTGQLDSTSRSPDTSKPKQRKKRQAKTKASKRSS